MRLIREFWDWWRPLAWRILPLALLAPPLLLAERLPAVVPAFSAALLAGYIFWRIWALRSCPELATLVCIFGGWGLAMFLAVGEAFPAHRFYLFLTGLATLLAPPPGSDVRSTGGPEWPAWAQLTAAAVAGLAVLAPLVGDVYWRRKYFHVAPLEFLQSGELIDTNILAAVLAGALPAAVVWTIYGKRGRGGRSWNKVGAAVALVLVLELVLTQSRAAWLGAAAGLAYLAWARWPWIRWACAAGVAAGVGFLAVWGLSPVIDWLARSAEVYTASGRVAVWEASLPGVGDFPVTGIGPGRFLEVIPRLYYSDVAITPESAWKHAHSLYLQAALDVGLPGFVALAALVVYAFAAAVRAGPRERWWLRGVTAGLVVLLVDGLVDAPLWLNKPHAFFFLLVGIAVACGATRGQSGNTRPGRITGAVLGMWLTASAVAVALAAWRPEAGLMAAGILGGALGWLAARSSRLARRW